MKKFLLFNLTIDSDLDVSNFSLQLTEKPTTDLKIRSSVVHFKKLFISASSPNYSLYSDSSYAEIYRKGFGKFVISNGTEVLYEKEKSILDFNFATYVLSNVMPYILYQRNFLVLHSSAISVNSKSYFFCGRSGVGKSYIAEKLLNYGHFVTEDVSCFYEKAKKLYIYNSLPFIKSSSDIIPNSIAKYPTQIDRRKRNIFTFKRNEEKINNEFSKGFFLRIGHENKIEKIDVSEAFKNIFSNSFSSYPKDTMLHDQKNEMKRISNLVNKGSFYNIFRKKSDNFCLDSLFSIIREDQ